MNAIRPVDRAPLLGHNLVRLLYLDEAGTDRKAAWLTVAGVIVHGDEQWPEIDMRILALIDKYVPPADRAGFVFHATDIFHGAKYFDRRKPEWPESRRMEVLCDLATIISDLRLPVVAGFYEKAKLAKRPNAADAALAAGGFGNFIHNAAALDCLRWADMWLEKYSPTELATVVHEDGTPVKALIKFCTRLFRNKEALAAAGFGGEAGIVGFPLKRIIDTVHFAEKADARPLQLADLCAFTINRAGRPDAKPLPQIVQNIVWGSAYWVTRHELVARFLRPVVEGAP